MANEAEQWRPGSFTKNFSWGHPGDGLVRLHENIRLGFDGEIKDVLRSDYRARVQKAGRPDFVPINFFLFNKVIDGQDHIIVDELVFQALTEDHSPAFDKLALFAFLLSYVGWWIGAKNYQRRPALWATRYVEERVAIQFGWNASRVSADDIERFVESDGRYKAQTARKLATNLNYLLKVGRLREFSEPKVERWWVNALFLALDRLAEDRQIDNLPAPEGSYGAILNRSDFRGVSGEWSLDKDLATSHLIALYSACGARERFIDERVRERTLAEPDLEWILANDSRPQGAVYPTNPNIVKSIPRACAQLAKRAGFDVIDADELRAFNTVEFVRRRTREALLRLKATNVIPRMSEDELRKITRES